ncbi:phosphoribosylformylglycinamidine cyclo-ligase [Roseimicrobium gellanilyticum]|uniref:Phosphoribosylformylglycinamidine cyclo-ligase n=2 Tax=Roseimicrobium gellanilyticum TaxID=748857 RepID=A0A366H3N4_9BACT|nr:phosphoribosylformylglycinamidine cyclo-ligase [Roseimicrobium gellanilyticum]
MLDPPMSQDAESFYTASSTHKHAEPPKGHTYKQAGVDIREAAALVGDIGQLVKRTQKQRQLAGAFGLFAAAYDLSAYKHPVIVTGCDGVGTKLELLLKHDLLENAGKDLVAMNVNDVLTTGADPILFLDYVGVGKLAKDKITRCIAGMVEYLEACGCILAGGETAEMPGMVQEGVIELSGFAIGAAEKGSLIDPTTIQRGDVLVGFPSAGFHANGFSLVRRVIEAEKLELTDEEYRTLLLPTRLYHEEAAALRKNVPSLRAMSHVTGGGLPENLGRLMVFGGHGAHLRVPRWQNAVVQKILAHADEKDAFDTFNMGFGWVAIVAKEDADKALACGQGAVVLGEIDGSGEVTVELV